MNPVKLWAFSDRTNKHSKIFNCCSFKFALQFHFEVLIAMLSENMVFVIILMMSQDLLFGVFLFCDADTEQCKPLRAVL